MKRAKKIIRKPDLAEESSGASDSDEEHSQPVTKRKVKKAMKMPKTIDHADSDEVSTSPPKKGKAKGKIAMSPKPEDSDGETSEMPKKSSRNVKGKGKKAIKIQEPAEETPNNTDADDETSEMSKKTSKNAKGKGKKLIKLQRPSEDSPVKSDSDNDLTQTPEKAKQNSKNAKGKEKKPMKLQEPAKDSSHSSDSDGETTEKPKQTLKSAKGKRKKPVKLQEPGEESSHDSDSEAVTSQNKKKIKGKGKNAKVPKQAEDTSHNSDSEEGPPTTAQKSKGKKILKKPEPAEEPSDSSESNGNVEDENPGPKEEMEKPSVQIANAHWRTEGAFVQRPISPERQSKIKGKIDLYLPKQGEGNDDLSDGELSSDTEQDSNALFNPQSHKQSLRDLQSKDPSFYKFLQQHDAELLEFDENDDGLDEKEGDDDFEKVHVPGELHGDSDESDFEGDDAVPIKGKVTLKMVSELEAELTKKLGKVKLSSIVSAVKLFNAAVKRATSADGSTEGEFKVAGSSVFNRVVNMCVMYLPSGIKSYLGMDKMVKNPLKCKHFVKIKGTLVQYLSDLVKLLEVVTSDNILTVMLKHLHQIARFVACFTRIAKKVIKRLLPLWSSGEETVRVLAFMCIMRVTRSQQPVVHEAVLKAMFMTYVRNSKFVSPTTWPGINFMRRSLAEMFILDLDIAYPLVFLYIRQLGIHLRNAIMVPTKDHKLAVYNWQFINSLHLWAVLIEQTVEKPEMKTLLFPLSMIISNTIKLVPTAQYYPLRFHLTEMLMDLSRESGHFIPVMGFLVGVLTKFDFNKKHKKVSMKPLDFSCLLRVSKSQMSENGFKDAVVDRLYALALEYAATLSWTLSFPDVMVILIVFLRDVVNKCTVPNHKKKLKQLLEKFEEGSEYMRKLRFSYKMSYCNVDALRGWEEEVRAKGTPLMTYYADWSKVNNIQKRKKLTNNDEQASAIPKFKRLPLYNESDALFKDNTVHPMKLFPSDSEDETDHFKDVDENKAPPKKKKVTKKKVQKKENIKQKNEVELPDTADAGDIVQEFSASDW